MPGWIGVVGFAAGQLGGRASARGGECLCWDQCLVDRGRVAAVDMGCAVDLVLISGRRELFRNSEDIMVEMICTAWEEVRMLEELLSRKLIALLVLPFLTGGVESMTVEVVGPAMR